MNNWMADGKIAEHARTVCQKAGAAIDNAVANGHRMPVVKLSESIAAELGADKVFAYHIISAYIKLRPELFVFKGPGGGVGLKVVEPEKEKENG